LRGVPGRSDLGYLTLFEALNPNHIQVGQHYKEPRQPIFVVCSESHYSVLFSTAREMASLPGRAEVGSFEMHYYDELGRQDEEVIMTLTVDAEALEANAAKDPNDAAAAAAAWKENAVPPLELVLRTRWPAARVDWNGTDPIL
jgi:ubiquitin carboxyl-terminal hydrolase MINDY-3/4